jgi:hypothetical protein
MKGEIKQGGKYETHAWGLVIGQKIYGPLRSRSPFPVDFNFTGSSGVWLDGRMGWMHWVEL